MVHEPHIFKKKSYLCVRTPNKTLNLIGRWQRCELCKIVKKESVWKRRRRVPLKKSEADREEERECHFGMKLSLRWLVHCFMITDRCFLHHNYLPMQKQTTWEDRTLSSLRLSEDDAR